MTGLLSRLTKAANQPWLWVGILSLGIILMGGLVLWIFANQSPTGRTAEIPAAEPGILFHPSPTPFLPVIQPSVVLENPSGEEKTKEILPTVEFTLEPLPFWQDFDFSVDAGKIEIHLLDQTRNFYDGKPVVLRFTPGGDCPFGTGRGCVSQHAAGRYLLLTLHSGVSGEAQQLRHALEGTGINSAGLKSAEIQVNLENLRSSIASLHQGFQNLDYLSVRAALRIPPDQIEAYYSQPFVEALDAAAQSNLLFQELLNSGEPLIFIETCGWPVSGEPAAEGDYKGTGSVYLVAIGSDG